MSTVQVTERTWLRKADNDVVVPRAVEHKIRAMHPPEQHEAKIEEARGYYRTLRTDRQNELKRMREPDELGVRQVEPSPAQAAAITAHKQRKKLWPKKRRKVRYPVNKYPPGYPSEKTGLGVSKSEPPEPYRHLSRDEMFEGSRYKPGYIRVVGMPASNQTDNSKPPGKGNRPKVEYRKATGPWAEIERKINLYNAKRLFKSDEMTLEKAFGASFAVNYANRKYKRRRYHTLRRRYR